MRRFRPCGAQLWASSGHRAQSKTNKLEASPSRPHLKPAENGPAACSARASLISRLNKKTAPAPMDQPNTDPTQPPRPRCAALPAGARTRGTRATLERERAEHGRSASAVAHHREASVVKLSIGGTHFTTSRSTLVPASGFFSAYLAGRVAQPTLDDAGAIFVDREAQHFPKILAFLRDGAMPRWGSDEEREALEHEADFYRIEGAHARRGPRGEYGFRRRSRRTSACATRRTSSGRSS